MLGTFNVRAEVDARYGGCTNIMKQQQKETERKSALNIDAREIRIPYSPRSRFGVSAEGAVSLCVRGVQDIITV